MRQSGHGQLGSKAKERRVVTDHMMSRQVCTVVAPDPVIMTLQIPNYTVCLNLFENHLAYVFYHTFDFNLFIAT